MDPHRTRLQAQLLSGPPAPSVGAVVERLLAVQAQELRAARLGVRARSTGLRAADVDAALARRELVVTWVNRGTLHLVRSEDLPWLHAVTTPQLASTSTRRLAQEGVSPHQAERGVAAVERELGDGPRTRPQLKAVLDTAGVPTAGQALVHVLLAATLAGVCVRGPVVGADQAFVLVRDWLPVVPPVDRDVALGELARRYLVGHGPSSDRDLVKWAGITVGAARRGLTSAGAVPSAFGDGLLELPGGASREPLPVPTPRLLGPWDELLMGWASRETVVGAHTSVVTKNGMFWPVAVVDGRVVGTWSLVRGQVALDPLEPIAPESAAALEAEAADVRRFLAVTA